MREPYKPEERTIPLTWRNCRRRIKEDGCLEGAIILAPFQKNPVTGSCSENRACLICPAGFR